jgi:beta-N-acetylhexosaminidase
VALCAVVAAVVTGCTGQPGTGASADKAHQAKKATGTPRPSPSGRTTSASRSRATDPIGTGWGPSRAEIDKARRLVDAMPLHDRAGQVIVASYSGTGAPTRMVNRLHLGGVIVFSANVSGTAQIRHSNRALQHAAHQAGRKWPVLVGVDQEGGIVERVAGGTDFPAFMTAGAANNRQLTKKAYAAAGGELASLGFTMDFAPDADVTVGPGDPTIGSRSAGSRPALVAREATAAANGFTRSGVVPVVKHFPGHGSVTTDSHVTLPVQRASLRHLMHHDFVPFKAAVRDGLPSVMVGHIDVRAVDPGVPSSLSHKVVTGLLRDRLGFQGLVVSDSLVMGAVHNKRYSTGRSAVQALRAGDDVLLMPARPRVARDAIVRAVRDGRLPQSRLDQAATRQVALLLHQRDHGTRPKPPGSASRLAGRLSAAGVTVVQGRCRGRLVGRSVRVTGPGTAVAAFRSAAHHAGLRTGSGPKVALVGYGGSAPRRSDVLVSTDTPYVLDQGRARAAKIAAYGESPSAMTALVRVLTGRATAPGRLPVRVPGLARSGCPVGGSGHGGAR